MAYEIEHVCELNIVGPVQIDSSVRALSSHDNRPYTDIKDRSYRLSTVSDRLYSRPTTLLNATL